MAGAPRLVLDFRIGEVAGGLASALPFTFVPPHTELVDVPDHQNLELSEIDLLRMIGVPAVYLQNSYRLAAVLGESPLIINDISDPRKGDGFVGSDVTANRVYNQAASSVLKLYKTLYVGQELDADGNLISENKSPHIRKVVAKAWVDYQAADHQGQLVDFQEYLRSGPGTEEASAYVGLLRVLFGRLELMGLTQREMAHAKTVLLERENLIPRGMDRQAFERVILNTVPAQAGIAPAQEDVLERDGAEPEIGVAPHPIGAWDEPIDQAGRL